MTNDVTKLSQADLLAVIAQLQKENRELAAKPANKIRYKVSDKGALSVYGLNVRFPVTLYVGQWERLVADLPAMQAFMKANQGQLARKQ